MIDRELIANSRANLEERLSSYGTSLAYVPNEIIFSQDETREMVFYLKDGLAKLCIYGETGSTKMITFIKEGHFFGYSVLLGYPFGMTAVAMKACRVVGIDTNTFLKYFDEDGDMARISFYSLLKRFMVVGKEIHSLSFESGFEKVTNALRYFVKYNSSEAMANGEKGLVKVRVRQQEIADMAGVTRVTVSNIMNKLKEEDVIKWNSRGTIMIDESRLQLLKINGGR